MVSISRNASQSWNRFCSVVAQKIDLTVVDRAFNAIIVSYAAVIAVLFGFVPAYWLIFQSEITYFNLQSPSLERSVVKTGTSVIYRTENCAVQNVPESVDYQLVPKTHFGMNIYIFTASLREMQMRGSCRQQMAELPLSNLVPPGHYDLIVKRTFVLNPLKTVTQYERPLTFEVTK